MKELLTNSFAVSSLLTGLTSLAMGLFVLSKGPRNAMYRLWFLFTGSVAVWGFGGMWIALEASGAHSLLAWRLAFALGVLWIPILFFHFVTVFCGLQQRRILIFNYVIGLVIFPLILFSSLFFGSVRFVFSSFYYAQPGSALFYAFFIWWVGLVLYAHYQVLKIYHHASGLKRNQFKYFFVAFSLAYGTGSLDYLPIFGIDFYPHGNWGIIFYPIVMTYAIFQYRLMDITVAISKGLAYGLFLGLILIPTYLAVFISGRATLHSVPPLLAGTLIFSCGLWVVLSNPRAVTNRAFGLLCLGVCTWLFSFFMIYSTTDEQAALFWGKVVYSGVAYVPAAFYHFCVSFLRDQQGKKLIPANYLISTFFLLLISAGFLLDGQYKYYWGYYPKAGVLHPLFLVYFASVSGLALWKLYWGYKAKQETEPLEAARTKYIFWAFVVGYIASIDFVQDYGFEFYPAGFLFVTLWFGIVTYAIVKYQLLEFSLLLTKAKLVQYARPLFVIPLYLGMLLLQWLFDGSLRYVEAGVLTGIFLLLAEGLARLTQQTERAVGKTVFPKQHNAYETLRAFSSAVLAKADLLSLKDDIVRTIAEALDIKTTSLYLLESQQDIYIQVASYGYPSPPNVHPSPSPSPSGGEGTDRGLVEVVAGTDDLPCYLATNQELVVREELEHAPDPETMGSMPVTLQALEAEVCIPLMGGNRLIGFLNLGVRARRQAYSQEDLHLLAALARNAAIALHNALLVDELKRAKVMLQRLDRLRSLETIAGGFAHEVRNPLTSVKAFVQLVPEQKDNPEFIGAFNKIVIDDVARIERLIQEILDYARYMEPKLQEESVDEIVEECLYPIQIKADEKAITLEKDLAGNLSPVLVDRQQLKQVCMNLFLNALDAMNEGDRLTVRTKRWTKPSGEAWVQVEVTDTGSGIAPADLEHIFDPFYTTKHESKEREGTGLGLTIVHQIIQEHGGVIDVKSELGRGTTFFVNLPVKPVQQHAATKPELHKETGK